MPLYDYVCDSCGFEDEYMIKLADFEGATIWCTECSEEMRRIISPVMTTGIVFSNALTITQVGKTFNSNRELREYVAENPKYELQSRGEKAWRDHDDWARERADAQAKRMGYTDLDDHHRRKTAERKKKQELGS